MRTASWCIAVLALAGPVSAQQPESRPAAVVSARHLDDAQVRALRRMTLLRRAHDLRPQRRDEPLRYENITDIEVREIQRVAEKYIPKSIVNISPVVTGCPCEEGPQCTDQVYIVANGPASSVGLQLSRVQNSWQIGVVQQWWLRYDALLARRDELKYRAYEASEAELLRELPQCAGELVPAATASNPPEVKK